MIGLKLVHMDEFEPTREQAGKWLLYAGDKGVGPQEAWNINANLQMTDTIVRNYSAQTSHCCIHLNCRVL